MKRIAIIGLLACVGTLPMQAQTFSIPDFSIPAGGVTDVEICLDCEDDKWGAFQFDLKLPVGIHVVEDEYGMYYEPTGRLQYTQGRQTVTFNINGALQSDGQHYRILVDNSHARSIPGGSGALMTLRLQADDFVDTDITLGIDNIVCTGPTGTGTVYPDNIAQAGRGTIRLDVSIGAAGWATYSWPRSVDFSGTGIEAFVATELTNGSLHLEPVTRVVPNTGLLLHAEPGLYHPKVGSSPTPYDQVAYDCILQATSSGEVTAAGGSCYALAKHEGELGFYAVTDGVVIPQYRAYLQVSPSAGAPQFVGFDNGDVAVKVSGVQREAVKDNAWYRLDGVRVQQPTQPGIYVKQGKKIKL